MKITWYVTRKFPPSIGGMQNLSYHIASELAAHRQLELVRWGGSALGLPWFGLFATLRLAAGLLQRKVGVLLLGDPSLAWLGLLAKLFGVKVAVVVHGLDVTYPGRLYQAYLRHCFWQRFDAYICISSHVRQLAVSHGTSSERTYLIHPGVDIKTEASGGPTHGGEVTLLLLGRLVRRKGALWFVNDVVPALVQKVPNLRVNLVGDGPDREDIQDSIVRLGLQEHVSLAGAVGEEEKSRHLSLAHALVIPNLPTKDDPEGFGLVALEGAAAGRYVFAADLEGLRDAVRVPHMGRLLPPARADMWIQVLVSECRDAAGLLELGARAKESLVVEGASWSHMGKRYVQVLDALA